MSAETFKLIRSHKKYILLQKTYQQSPFYTAEKSRYNNALSGRKSAKITAKQSLVCLQDRPTLHIRE